MGIVYLSVSVSLCLCLCLSVCLSVSLSLSLALSRSLYLTHLRYNTLVVNSSYSYNFSIFKLIHNLISSFHYHQHHHPSISSIQVLYMSLEKHQNFFDPLTSYSRIFLRNMKTARAEISSILNLCEKRKKIVEKIERANKCINKLMIESCSAYQYSHAKVLIFIHPFISFRFSRKKKQTNITHISFVILYIINR